MPPMYFRQEIPTAEKRINVPGENVARINGEVTDVLILGHVQVSRVAPSIESTGSIFSLAARLVSHRRAIKFVPSEHQA